MTNLIQFPVANSRVEELIPFGNGISILNNVPDRLIKNEIDDHNFESRSFRVITAGDEMNKAMRHSGARMAALMFTMNGTRAIPELLNRIENVAPCYAAGGSTYWLLTNGTIDVLCRSDKASKLEFSLFENSPRTGKVPFEMHLQCIREFQKSMLQHVLAEHVKNPIESLDRWLKMPGVRNEFELITQDPKRIDRFFSNPNSDEFTMSEPQTKGFPR